MRAGPIPQFAGFDSSTRLLLMNWVLTFSVGPFPIGSPVFLPTIAACPKSDASRTSLGAAAACAPRGVRARSCTAANPSMNCATGLSAASADGFGLSFAPCARACEKRRGAAASGEPGAEDPRFELRVEPWCCGGGGGNRSGSRLITRRAVGGLSCRFCWASAERLEWVFCCASERGPAGGGGVSEGPLVLGSAECW